MQPTDAALVEASAPCLAIFDPFSRILISPIRISSLQRLGPRVAVFHSPKLDYWIVTRYRPMSAHVFQTPKIVLGGQCAPRRSSRFVRLHKTILAEGRFSADPVLTNADPPCATLEFRRLANIAFYAPRRVATMESFIRELAARFTREAFRETAAPDLIHDLAWELPALVYLPSARRSRPTTFPGSRPARKSRLLFMFRASEHSAAESTLAQGMATFLELWRKSWLRRVATEPRGRFSPATCWLARDKDLPAPQAATK